MNKNLKNIAIVAHVDHGKTTLIDCILKQSNSSNARGFTGERIMDSGDLEKERGITITAKNCAFVWNDTKINLLDTPGHSDFGGEVERSLMMVDGILLLVDASEGPLPQTRFVLSKALERDLKVAVVINKIDRPDERIDEVISEIEDLFLDLVTLLHKDDYNLDIPIYYASAKLGYAKKQMSDPNVDLKVLLDLMTSDYFPSPVISEGNDLQLLVTNLTYNSYLGMQAIGRIQRGSILHNNYYILCDEFNRNNRFKVSNIQIFDALGTQEVQKADAGEIVLVSGLEGAKIGDTISSATKIEPLPRISVDPPTVSIRISVSTSPFSGQDGEYLTSRKLEESLNYACKHNVALQYSPTDDPKEFELKGRGELQLAIVFEEIRRAGYELMISRPKVLMKEIEGELHEPYESVILDVLNQDVGTITETLSKRKGILKNMMPLGDLRTRIEFECPSRGLIGYRSDFLTDTRGEGTMSSRYIGHRKYAGDMLSRQSGALVADRGGRATPYALFNLLNNGRQFIRPNDMVYEGQVIGESNKKNDINVHVAREKHLSSVRTAGKDDNIILPPVQPLTIEKAMNWIDDDEWVEITPKNIRIRKKILQKNLRSTIR